MLKRLFIDSLSIVFRNLDAVFKVCGAWFAIPFIILFGIYIGLTFFAYSETSVKFIVFTGFSLILVCAVLSTASIAAAWHRFSILQEAPSTIHLKFGSKELWLVLRSLALVLGLLLAMLLVVLVHVFLRNPIMTGLIGIPLLIFVAPAFFRFSLVLPATAIGKPLTFGEAFDLGEGLGWQMFFTTLLLFLPFAMINKLLEYFLEVSAGSLPAFLIEIKVMVLYLVLQMILTVLLISVISAGYKIGMERLLGPTPLKIPRI